MFSYIFLDFLESFNPEKDDEESDPKIELPLWMIQVFLAGRSIQFDMPKAYNEIYRYNNIWYYYIFIFWFKLYSNIYFYF